MLVVVPAAIGTIIEVLLYKSLPIIIIYCILQHTCVICFIDVESEEGVPNNCRMAQVDTEGGSRHVYG